MASDASGPARSLLPWGIGAGLAAVVATGFLVLPGLRLDPPPDAAETQRVVTLAEPENPPAPTDPLPAADVGEPRFDLVRMERDGTTLVAGQAMPRSRVSVVVDGVTRSHTYSDETGQFVVFLALEASSEPRVLWLTARGQGGEMLSSVDTVILAPDGAVREPSDGPGLSGSTQSTENPGEETPPGIPTARLAVPPANQQSLPTVQTAGPSDPTIADEPADQPGHDAPLPGDPAPDGTIVTAVLKQPVATPATPKRQTDTAPIRPARALLNDADGVRLLNPPPLDGAGKVRVDSLEYGADAGVVLRGRAEAGGTVAALLDGTEQAEISPDPQGAWVLHLADVKPGTYALGVVRRNASGQVTDRVDLPFRREDPGVIAAALSGAPAQVVTVQPGSTLWAIARERYGDGTHYVQVYDANRSEIRNPDLIYPGQVFKLPVSERP